MEEAGESVATGSTSTLEMIAIARIVQNQYGMDSDDWTEWTNFNSKDILAAYIQGTPFIGKSTQLSDSTV